MSSSVRSQSAVPAHSVISNILLSSRAPQKTRALKTTVTNYGPRKLTPVVNSIVAVHGLNPRNKVDHARATWTALRSRKLWLRDFLPNQIPKARIMIFGYNANVALGSGTDGVCEQATNLCQCLYHERQEAPNRSLIFICHSLGGLVVKRVGLNTFPYCPEPLHYNPTTLLCSVLPFPRAPAFYLRH